MTEEEYKEFDSKYSRRYSYFIRYGSDTIHVAPLQQNILHKVLNLVPYNLKKWRSVLGDCIQDMKDDYTRAIKTCIIDFVLSDPFASSASERRLLTKERIECEELTLTSKSRFILMSASVQKSLYLVNPCIHALLNLFYKHFE